MASEIAGKYLRKWSHEGKSGYSFFCPGCERSHSLRTEFAGHPNWEFNGNLEKPSFTPSVKLGTEPSVFCHLFVTDGKVIFLGDCRHELKGKTVDLPEWPADYGY